MKEAVNSIKESSQLDSLIVPEQDSILVFCKKFIEFFFSNFPEIVGGFWNILDNKFNISVSYFQYFMSSVALGNKDLNIPFDYGWTSVIKSSQITINRSWNVSAQLIVIKPQEQFKNNETQYIGRFTIIKKPQRKILFDDIYLSAHWGSFQSGSITGVQAFTILAGHFHGIFHCSLKRNINEQYIIFGFSIYLSLIFSKLNLYFVIDTKQLKQILKQIQPNMVFEVNLWAKTKRDKKYMEEFDIHSFNGVLSDIAKMKPNLSSGNNLVEKIITKAIEKDDKSDIASLMQILTTTDNQQSITQNILSIDLKKNEWKKAEPVLKILQILMNFDEDKFSQDFKYHVEDLSKNYEILIGIKDAIIANEKKNTTDINQFQNYAITFKDIQNNFNFIKKTIQDNIGLDVKIKTTELFLNHLYNNLADHTNEIIPIYQKHNIHLSNNVANIEEENCRSVFDNLRQITYKMAQGRTQTKTKSKKIIYFNDDQKDIIRKEKPNIGKLNGEIKTNQLSIIHIFFLLVEEKLIKHYKTISTDPAQIKEKAHTKFNQILNDLDSNPVSFNPTLIQEVRAKKINSNNFDYLEQCLLETCQYLKTTSEEIQSQDSTQAANLREFSEKLSKIFSSDLFTIPDEILSDQYRELFRSLIKHYQETFINLDDFFYGFFLLNFYKNIDLSTKISYLVDLDKPTKNLLKSQNYYQEISDFFKKKLKSTSNFCTLDVPIGVFHFVKDATTYEESELNEKIKEAIKDPGFDFKTFNQGLVEMDEENSNLLESFQGLNPKKGSEENLSIQYDHIIYSHWPKKLLDSDRIYMDNNTDLSFLHIFNKFTELKVSEQQYFLNDMQNKIILWKQANDNQITDFNHKQAKKDKQNIQNFNKYITLYNYLYEYCSVKKNIESITNFQNKISNEKNFVDRAIYKNKLDEIIELFFINFTLSEILSIEKDQDKKINMFLERYEQIKAEYILNKTTFRFEDLLNNFKGQLKRKLNLIDSTIKLKEIKYNFEDNRAPADSRKATTNKDGDFLKNDSIEYLEQSYAGSWVKESRIKDIESVKSLIQKPVYKIEELFKDDISKAKTQKSWIQNIQNGLLGSNWQTNTQADFLKNKNKTQTSKTYFNDLGYYFNIKDLVLSFGQALGLDLQDKVKFIESTKLFFENDLKTTMDKFYGALNAQGIVGLLGDFTNSDLKLIDNIKSIISGLRLGKRVISESDSYRIMEYVRGFQVAVGSKKIQDLFPIATQNSGNFKQFFQRMEAIKNKLSPIIKTMGENFNLKTFNTIEQQISSQFQTVYTEFYTKNLASIKTQYDEFDKQYKTKEQKLQKKQKELSTLERDLKNLQMEEKNKNDEIVKLKTEQGTNQRELTRKLSDLKTAQLELKTAESELQQANLALQNLKSELQNLQKDLQTQKDETAKRTITKNIKSKEKDMNTNQTKINFAKNKLETSEKVNTKFQKERETLQQKEQNFTTDITKLEKQVSELKTKTIPNKEEKIKELKENIAKKETELVDLQTNRDKEEQNLQTKKKGIKKEYTKKIQEITDNLKDKLTKELNQRKFDIKSSVQQRKTIKAIEDLIDGLQTDVNAQIDAMQNELEDFINLQFTQFENKKVMISEQNNFFSTIVDIQNTITTSQKKIKDLNKNSEKSSIKAISNFISSDPNQFEGIFGLDPSTYSNQFIIQNIDINIFNIDNSDFSFDQKNPYTSGASAPKTQDLFQADDFTGVGQAIKQHYERFELLQTKINNNYTFLNQQIEQKNNNESLTSAIIENNKNIINEIVDKQVSTLRQDLLKRYKKKIKPFYDNLMFIDILENPIEVILGYCNLKINEKQEMVQLEQSISLKNITIGSKKLVSEEYIELFPMMANFEIKSSILLSEENYFKSKIHDQYIIIEESTKSNLAAFLQEEEIIKTRIEESNPSTKTRIEESKKWIFSTVGYDVFIGKDNIINDQMRGARLVRKILEKPTTINISFDMKTINSMNPDEQFKYFSKLLRYINGPTDQGQNANLDDEEILMQESPVSLIFDELITIEIKKKIQKFAEDSQKALSGENKSGQYPNQQWKNKKEIIDLMNYLQFHWEAATLYQQSLFIKCVNSSFTEKFNADNETKSLLNRYIGKAKDLLIDEVFDFAEKHLGIFSKVAMAGYDPQVESVFFNTGIEFFSWAVDFFQNCDESFKLIDGIFIDPLDPSKSPTIQIFDTSKEFTDFKSELRAYLKNFEIACINGKFTLRSSSFDSTIPDIIKKTTTKIIEDIIALLPTVFLNNLKTPKTDLLKILPVLVIGRFGDKIGNKLKEFSEKGFVEVVCKFATAYNTGIEFKNSQRQGEDFSSLLATGYNIKNSIEVLNCISSDIPYSTSQNSSDPTAFLVENIKTISKNSYSLEKVLDLLEYANMASFNNNQENQGPFGYFERLTSIFTHLEFFFQNILEHNNEENIKNLVVKYYNILLDHKKETFVEIKKNYESIKRGNNIVSDLKKFWNRMNLEIKKNIILFRKDFKTNIIKDKDLFDDLKAMKKAFTRIYNNRWNTSQDPDSEKSIDTKILFYSEHLETKQDNYKNSITLRIILFLLNYYDQLERENIALAKQLFNKEMIDYLKSCLSEITDGSFVVKHQKIQVIFKEFLGGFQRVILANDNIKYNTQYLSEPLQTIVKEKKHGSFITIQLPEIEKESEKTKQKVNLFAETLTKIQEDESFVNFLNENIVIKSQEFNIYSLCHQSHPNSQTPKIDIKNYLKILLNQMEIKGNMLKAFIEHCKEEKKKIDIYNKLRQILTSNSKNDGWEANYAIGINGIEYVLSKLQNNESLTGFNIILSNDLGNKSLQYLKEIIKPYEKIIEETLFQGNLSNVGSADFALTKIIEMMNFYNRDTAANMQYILITIAMIINKMSDEEIKSFCSFTKEELMEIILALPNDQDFQLQKEQYQKLQSFADNQDNKNGN
jgi:hypothetical protein